MLSAWVINSTRCHYLFFFLILIVQQIEQDEQSFQAKYQNVRTFSAIKIIHVSMAHRNSFILYIFSNNIGKYGRINKQLA